MRRCPPPTSLTTALALMLGICAALLAAPAVSLAAHSHRPACATHAKRHARACVRRKRRGHVRHASVPRRLPGTSGALSAPAPVPSVVAVATCGDGSAPQSGAEETFSCQDGSEPGCEAGSVMSLSTDGTTLLCGAPPEGFDLEESCEPGAVCEGDAGEPGCEGVAQATAAAGAAECEAPPGEFAEGEG